METPTVSTMTMRDYSAKGNAVRLLMFGVFFTCSFRDVRFISFLSLQDILLFTVLFPLYFGLLESSKRKKLNIYLIISFFILLIFLCQSLMTSISPMESIFNYLKIFVAFALLPSAIWIFVHKIEDSYLLFLGYLSGVFISCLNSLIFKLGGSSGSRISGLSGHPVFFGILTATAIVIALSIEYRTKQSKFLSFIPIAVFAYAMVLSASSTGLVIVVSGLAVKILITLMKQKFLSLLITMTTLLTGGILVWNANFFSYSKARLLLSLDPQSGYSTNQISGISTFEARIFSLKYAWERIQDSPIVGHGLDTQGRVTSIGLEPHNMLFLSWQTGGLLLLALAIFFLHISLKYFILAIKLKFELGIAVILVTWLGLMTEPLIYERSILAPLFLVFITLNFESVKRRILRL